MKKLLILFLVVFVILSKAYASPPQGNAYHGKLEKKYTYWNVYTTVQYGQKLCYISSSPSHVNVSQSYAKARNDLFLVVTYISKSIDEVSVSSGFTYNQKIPVSFTIDNKKTYKLPVIDDKFAWAQNINDDKEIISAMKKGVSMAVEGHTSDGVVVKDKYSLIGFTKAYEQMRSLCKDY